MAYADTFDGLLEQLAAVHRREVEEAVSSLSFENHALKTQLAELQAQMADVSEHTPDSHDLPAPRLSRISTSGNFGAAVSASQLDRGMTIATRVVMAKKMDEINKHEQTKMLRRLQRILCDGVCHGDVCAQPLDPKKVLDALKKKGAHSYSLEQITQLLIELEEVASRHRSRREIEAGHLECDRPCVSLEDLVSLFMMHSPEQTMDRHLAAQFADLKRVLVAEDLHETIEKLATMPDAHAQKSGDRRLSERLQILSMLPKEEVREMPARLANILNSVVGVCVLASIVLVGVSLDNDPDHPVWLWVEGFFAFVFVVEVALKLHYYGWRQYFVGSDCGFNWLDLTVTVFATGDLFLSTLVHFDETRAFNGTMVLKGLRLFRFARLMKLFHSSPMLKQLAVMMSGFWIGAPSLMWSLIIIVMFIYVIAIGFRSFFVVKSSYSDLTPQALVERCGHGDFVELDVHGQPLDPACALHLIYGDEFFGTVPRSMVTVFRFMIGDTSTTGGKSLVQALDTTHQEVDDGAPNAAVPFYFFYIPFMIVVIFGIFNIITAIFVETTINGLKHSDNQIRRKRYYESRYVQRKLEELVRHIRKLKAEDNSEHSGSAGAHMEIDQATFYALMNNHEVKALLHDMDVILDETKCHFDLFDLEGIGQITVPHFLGTLLRLRGEPQKIDFVSSWSRLSKLHDNFHDFQQVVLTILQKVTNDQAKIEQRIQDACMLIGGASRCVMGI